MTVQTFQPTDLTPLSAAVGLTDLPAEMAAIVQWANTASAAQALVERIVDTPFMPAAFWPKFDPRDREAAMHARHQAVASGTAAVLYGGPLGLNPLQALANIHVVKGKPGLPAELMVALVRSHGHEVGIEDLTDHRCRVWGRRAGEEHVHRAEFTLDRAKKAGYTSQNAKYGTDPQAMLYARAASILCRQMAPEVLKGLTTVEEIGDEPDPDAAPAKGTRTVQRQPQPAAPRAAVEAPAPRTQGEPRQTPRPGSAAPAEAPSVMGLPQLPGEEPSSSSEGSKPGTPQADAPASEAHWRQLNARFVDLGVQGAGQKEARLKVVSGILGRAVASASDLTSDDAVLVLDNLTRAVVDEVLVGTRWAGAPSGETAAEALDGGPAQPSAADAARETAAGIDEQIAAARAHHDEVEARRAAEQAQADSIDPTMGEEWPA